MAFQSKEEKQSLKEKQAQKEKQALSRRGNSSGFTEDDQKGFRIMLIFSLCLHLLFFLYVNMVPLPSSTPTEQPTLDGVPERLVKLIITSRSMDSSKEKEEKEESSKQKEIQARIQKEATKPAPVIQPVKEAEPPRDTAKKQQPPDEKEQTAKKEQQVKKEQTAAEQEKKTAQKAPSAKDSKKESEATAPSSTETPNPSIVAGKAGEEASGEKKQGGEQPDMKGVEGKTPTPPPKKKVDLKSIGILGMISSSESSSPSSSSSTVDSQLNLLAKNAVNGGEMLVKQIEKADPLGKALTSEERNDELPLSKGKAGKAGSKKGGDARGIGEKEDEDGEKSVVLASAKKIDDLVAMHQQTDTVQLPTKGDLALQKIADVKISGPKSQSRTPDAIFEVVSSYKSSIVHCYNKALKQYSNLEGRFVVEFTITAQGDVSKAEVISSTLEKTNSGLEDCVISMIQSWHFLPIPIGTTTVVVYPFVFFPAM